MKKTKKKTASNKTQYGRLEHWKIDYDYLDQLTPDERAWLDKFNEEYYQGCFGEDPLHKDIEEQKGLRHDQYRTTRQDILIEADKDQKPEEDRSILDLDEIIDAKRRKKLVK